MPSKYIPELSPEDELRFWSKVQKSDGCWLWTGTKRTANYGCINIDGIQYLAHRVSYRLAYGDIPRELCCCHHCDNPACVRPDHLFLGTDADNVRDMVRKGRHVNVPKSRPEVMRRGDQHGLRLHPERIAKGERQGSAKLTEADVREIRDLYATGNYSLSELGLRFRVNFSAIGKIVRRERWAHIP